MRITLADWKVARLHLIDDSDPLVRLIERKLAESDKGWIGLRVHAWQRQKIDHAIAIGRLRVIQHAEQEPPHKEGDHADHER